MHRQPFAGPASPSVRLASSIFLRNPFRLSPPRQIMHVIPSVTSSINWACNPFRLLGFLFPFVVILLCQNFGDMHRASTQLPPTSDEERELEEAFINRGVNSYVEVVDDENEDVGGEPNNWWRRVAESSI
ncbi:hypothetical protein ZIOFF_022329 [Zingiber officinale]|uniref:Uncharacterized protein n=1 Tax=Zingiber officinale TaxID=94328 RepID=A0A8J5H2Q5_ZINOF|nr:hypothetical protein ZIOFF_022329 [Zingiber officinale]